MASDVDIRFHRMPRDASVEAAIQRWVARLEGANVEIQRARVTVAPATRQRTKVSLMLELANGSAPTTKTKSPDTYVSVANAFRKLRVRLLRAPKDTHAIAFGQRCAPCGP